VWLGLLYAVCNASLASICLASRDLLSTNSDHFGCLNLQCASGTAAAYDKQQMMIVGEKCSSRMDRVP